MYSSSFYRAIYAWQFVKILSIVAENKAGLVSLTDSLWSMATKQICLFFMASCSRCFIIFCVQEQKNVNLIPTVHLLVYDL